MKNSLKISSNFSIPWLGAFIVTCVLLETSVCGSSLKKHRKKAKVTVLIAWDFSPFPIFTTSSISTNASQLWQIRIILELKSKPYMIFFFFPVDCGWLLGCPTQLYKGSCFGVNLSHPNFSHIPKQQTYSNEVWKGYQLSRCWWVFEIWNLGQEKTCSGFYIVFILFLYQPINVLDRISKKLWSVGWKPGCLNSHDCASNGCKVAVVHITGAAEQPLGYFRGLWNPATQEQRLSYL